MVDFLTIWLLSHVPLHRASWRPTPSHDRITVTIFKDLLQRTQRMTRLHGPARDKRHI